MFYLGLFSFSFTLYIEFIFHMFSFFLFYVFSQVLFTMLLFLIVICLCAHKCQSSIKIYIHIYRSSYIVYIIEVNDLRNYEESFCQNENYAVFFFCCCLTYLHICMYIVYRINNLTKL